MSSGKSVLIALLAGLGAGILVSMSGSPQLARVVSFVEPVGTLWVNAIRMTVVPLVVSLLLVAICSARDGAAVGRVGGRALLVFLLLLIAAALFSLLIAPLLFAWIPLGADATAALRAAVDTSAQETSAELRALPGFAQWLTALVPTNPVRSAADGAMLPLIIFTVLFSLALARLRDGVGAHVVAFFQGIGEAMLVLVRWLIALAPIGVFALIIGPASRLGMTVAGAIGYYVLAISVALVVFTVLLYPIAAIVGRVPLSRFARSVFPAQSVALSSSSSLASLPALIEGANDGLRLPPSVTGFVLPLAVSTFKAAGPIMWTIAALFLARLYGVQLSMLQIATVALAAIALSFSTPGVPHGWLLLLAPVLSNVGIPAEGVGLLMAVDAIPDIFATAANVTADMTAATVLARIRGTAEVPGDSPAPVAV